MKTTKHDLIPRAIVMALAITATLFSGCTAVPEHKSAAAKPSLTPSESQQIAVDAFVYGYSLITTDVTRVQMSNVPKVEGLHAPTGQFINVKRYPPASFRGVSAPTQILSTRLPGLMSPSRRCSANPTWATASTCSRCPTCG